MTDKNVTDRKLVFRRVDAGCTENDYRAMFNSTDGLVSVIMLWTPSESHYRVYPILGNANDTHWVSPTICISREFTDIKTPMDLEALVAERMKGASVIGSENDFTINWDGVPVFKIQTPGHRSAHMTITVYRGDIAKEFDLDDRSVKLGGGRTGTIVDYNPRNTGTLNVIRIDNTLIGGIVETK